MGELASPRQLRASLLRWVLFLSPLLLVLGSLSGRLANSGENNAWFSTLARPAIYPPPVTFGIVWTILYLMMGVALALVVTARGAPLRTAAIAAFVVQFALNLAWSPLFFAAHRLGASVVLLVALVIAVAVCIALFRKVRPLAAWLLVPYLAWCLFATLLSWQLLQLNPGADGAQPGRAEVSVELG